ncbi:hypothetical protein M3Y99_01312500 [Aphelenchoides fujianensis]|nr:hypothetical protein M3Y99_01312500 [Aphelenchoides fujianensis]
MCPPFRPSPALLVIMNSMYAAGGPRYAQQRGFGPAVVERAPRFPRNTDKSRGLRHFSNRVCEKVKEKGQTNYNEVADELVAEYFDSLCYPPQSQEKQQYDSKNIRRRVYDALNVLMAMNIIEKEKKEIRWVGLPTSSVAERRRLEDERQQRRDRIRQKSDQLREYIIQLVAYKSLVHRNRENERNNGRPNDQSILFLPFIILNTERETNVDCAISHDKTEYAMTFDRPFEIHDDIEVLKRMGMAHGLDTGRIDEAEVERVKEYLPPALRGYVDQIIEQANNPQPEEELVEETTLDESRQQTPEQPDELERQPSEAPKPAVASTFVARGTPGSTAAAPSPGLPRANPPLSNVVTTRRFGGLGGRPLGGGFGAPVGYARPMFARGGIANRSYIQRAPNAARYVQPSQSAVFQNAQRSHTRQQLYLVQSNGGAPQPIQSTNRYQAYPPPRSVQSYRAQQQQQQQYGQSTSQVARRTAAQPQAAVQPAEYVEEQAAYEEFVEVDAPEAAEYYQME